MRQRIVARIGTLTARPDFWPRFWLACLLLWTLASAGRSLGTPWARAALTEALRWGAGVGLALALGGGLRRAAPAGRAVVLLAGAMALLGIWGGLDSARGGLTGPYRDHQLYGSALLVLLPFTVAVALTARRAAWRLGASAAGGAGALCLLLSETRSAWAGLLAAALVFGGLWLGRAGLRPRRWRVALVPAAALVSAVVGLGLLSGPAEMNAALGARAATLCRLSQDASWQGRLQAWRGAARLTAAHPLLGVGLGRYPGAQWAWTRTGRPLGPSARPSLSEEAHCFYLQTAAETGVAGVGLYLAALAALAAAGLRRLRQSRRHALSGRDALLMALLSALAGQSVDALASPSWQFSETSFLFWGVVGLGLAAVRGQGLESEAPDTPAVPSPLRRAGRLALSGAMAVAVATQVLPLGLLLTPVEAYSPPSGYVLSGISLALVPPTGPVVPSTRLVFQVTASYKNSAGATLAQNITADAGTGYGATLAYPIKTYLNASFPGGVFTVQTLSPTYIAGKSLLSVTASYQGLYSKQVVVSIQPS